MSGRTFRPARRLIKPQQGSLQRSWRTASWMVSKAAPALPGQQQTKRDNDSQA